MTKRDTLLVDHFSTDQDAGKPSPGDTLGYEIVVRNIGNGPATDVVLTDVPDPQQHVGCWLGADQPRRCRGGNSADDWLAVVGIGVIWASGEQVTVTSRDHYRAAPAPTFASNQATSARASLARARL
ncbi:MAG: DUF11 domain-containing protein [Caldilineaceae bacterium]